MRMIKCQVVIHVAAAAVRKLFTRQKALLWCYQVGFSHVLNEKCVHLECLKTRRFLQRGILYHNKYNGVCYVKPGYPVDYAQVQKNKELLKVQP